MLSTENTIDETVQEVIPVGSSRIIKKEGKIGYLSVNYDEENEQKDVGTGQGMGLGLRKYPFLVEYKE